VRPVFNYAYDGYRDQSGPALGVEIGVADKISVLGEYFPITGDENDSRKNCFLVGARYSTWGHQFMLGLSNSQGIGTIGQLSGAPTNDISFALSIRRIL